MLVNINAPENCLHYCQCGRCKPSNVPSVDWRRQDPRLCPATHSTLKSNGLWHCDKPTYKHKGD